MTIPEVYRRADIGKIAQAVVTPPVAVPAVPTAGASMDDWEGLIDFITRFSTQFERVIGIIKGVQDGQNGNSTEASGKPKETEFSTPTPEASAPAPTLTVTPAIPPILVYQKLLGYLAKCPPETTAAELLEMAKEHKDAVLATIKEAISEVTSNVRA